MPLGQGCVRPRGGVLVGAQDIPRQGRTTGKRWDAVIDHMIDACRFPRKAICTGRTLCVGRRPTEEGMLISHYPRELNI